MLYTKWDLERYECIKNSNIENCIDYLTGVLDRRTITSIIEEKIKNKEIFSIAICDVDNFKNINDTYGHYEGDKTLEAVSKAMVEKTKGIGLIGRFGGDEFLILFENENDYDEIWKKIKNVHTRVKALFNDETLPTREVITVTTGIARFPVDSNDYEGLFKKADKALYRGKMKGRNCFIIYKDELHKNIDTSVKSPLVAAKNIILEANKIMASASNNKINELLSLIGNGFLIDHICVNQNNKLTYEYKKATNLNEYSYIDNSYFDLFNCQIYQTFDYTNINKQSNELAELLYKQNVKAIVFIRLVYNNRFLGYLRIEDSTTKRIWQEQELIIYLVLSEYISWLLQQ